MGVGTKDARAPTLKFGGAVKQCFCSPPTPPPTICGKRFSK